MKKTLSLILALVMVFALGCFAGCGGSDNADASSKTDTANSSENNTQAAPVTTVTAGKLTMATNAFFPPYEYYEGEKIIGIDAEIAEAIANKLGLQLEIKDMEFSTIITAVNAGDADVGIAGMTVTPDRKLEVDFSVSYANGVQAIIVKEGSAITCADDLYADGVAYKIGVQLGTTGDNYCCDDFGSDRVTQYANGNEAIVALLGGDVDCVIIDNEPAKSYVANNEGLKILNTTYADEDYAIAIKKGNDALREAIDKAILELTADGTIDSIIDKYIK